MEEESRDLRRRLNQSKKNDQNEEAHMNDGHQMNRSQNDDLNVGQQESEEKDNNHIYQSM